MGYYTNEKENFTMIFSSEIKPMCIYCEHAKAAIGDDDNHMVCRYKGVVTFDFSCRKYIYDPLKRIPRRRPLPLPELYEEFKL
jgi:hypothetical protein